MRLHFQSATKEVAEVVQSVVEVQHSQILLVGSFGAAALNDMKGSYLGDMNYHDEVFVQQVFANMPLATKRTAFSCLNDT